MLPQPENCDSVETMTEPSPSLNDLELALALADLADEVTLGRFQAADLAVSRKADSTFVTDADRHTEDVLRQYLQTHRSGDGIFGEERGASGESNRTWVIDPIDGTANFLRGVPVWATLIALVIDEEVKVGVVSAPALQRRWWAARGEGAFSSFARQSPRRLQVSEVRSWEQASLSYSSLTGWRHYGHEEQFRSLMDKCWRTRGFGDFWSYMLVAEGVVDIACEPELEVYDMAALVPIVEEAGGKFTSLAGQPGPWGGNALATNGHFHQRVLDHLEWH